jgi:hypothetical protein
MTRRSSHICVPWLPLWGNVLFFDLAGFIVVIMIVWRTVI